MKQKLSPFEFVKRNGLFMLVGLLTCGLVGYFLGGSDGRAFGGGIGAAVGLAVGGLLTKTRPG